MLQTKVVSYRLGCRTKYGTLKACRAPYLGRKMLMTATYRPSRLQSRRLRVKVSAKISEWAGRKISFMQANDHPRDRQGTWNVAEVTGTAKSLVEEDKEAGSWLKKLQLVQNVIAKDESKPADVNDLSLSHIYLTWVNRGVLPCVEAGGHYRPKHHAETSKSIFSRLERYADEHRHENLFQWILRGLHVKLTSFSEEFRSSEPLTRIRDIAHRNDIPKDMKHEIKHTLQNKLHRNAGPEDLVAAELMYEKILKQKDQLNDDFVKQYSLFMSELREFFNAGNLTESLKKVRDTMYGVDEAGVQIINRFLERQSDLADGYEQLGSFDLQTNEIMEALHSVTSVRALLLSKLSSGVRDDAPDDALVRRQTYRLSEIRSEDYAFVLLSRFINVLEKHHASFKSLVEGSDRAWALPLGALILGLRHIALSDWEAHECMIIENELSMWHKLDALGKPSNALRMRATLERLQRLCSNFCDSILETFAGNAQTLGKALGVSGHHVDVYSESEIRSNIVFQVSKLTSYLLKATRQAAGQTAWDTLVPGLARGRIVHVNNIDSIALPKNICSSEKLILVVKRATGDEDVAHLVAGFNGSGMKVTGIILCQELPHLSHLGVRARQEHLVFATCTDNELISDTVMPFASDYVELQAMPEGVNIRASSPSESVDEETGIRPSFKGNICVPSVQNSERNVLPQTDATTETCGAKAANCGIIEEIVSKTDAFKAPTGVVIPFGVMERCLPTETLDKINQLLVKVDQCLDKHEDISDLTSKIQDLVKTESDPHSVWKSVRDQFERNQKVIVRSSANVEDLAGLSGAGLHDSIQNINVYHPKEMAEAIVGVWASLYTRRALMARHAAGLSHQDARMAVLIQEQLSPSLSFVLHTTDTLTKDQNVLNAEIAPGVGETLASGTRGTPWRLAVNKTTCQVQTTAFANFSTILLPRGPHDESWTVDDHMMTRIADYTDLPLSVDDETRELLGQRLLKIGQNLEQEFGCVAQDIEGALVENDVYIVQSRPQPL